MQQLSEQILSFTIQVKCPKTGKDVEARFTRLAIDHCIYRYEDAIGRIMLVLHYVDDIIAATTDRALRGGQLAAKAGNGEQMCGMVPGLGSVSGCPHSPVATSARCVWTQVHAGVVGIYCDQPVCDRCVVFGRRVL